MNRFKILKEAESEPCFAPKEKKLVKPRTRRVLDRSVLNPAGQEYDIQALVGRARYRSMDSAGVTGIVGR